MFQSRKIPANRSKRFARLLNFVDEKANVNATNDQNEMILEGKPLAGSNFDQYIRNLYVANADFNLTDLSDLTPALAQAKLSPSAISNTKLKSLVSRAMSTEFHSPQAESPPRSAPSSPTTTETVHPLEPDKVVKPGRPLAAPSHQPGPSSKAGKAGQSKVCNGRIPPCERCRMLKLCR